MSRVIEGHWFVMDAEALTMKCKQCPLTLTRPDANAVWDIPGDSTYDFCGYARPPSPPLDVMVYKTDGKTKYLCCVPASEAGNYERAKL